VAQVAKLKVENEKLRVEVEAAKRALRQAQLSKGART
jgi:hypothetical protein